MCKSIVIALVNKLCLPLYGIVKSSIIIMFIFLNLYALTPYFKLWLGIQQKPFIPSLQKRPLIKLKIVQVDDNVNTGRNSLRSSLFHHFFAHIRTNIHYDKLIGYAGDLSLRSDKQGIIDVAKTQ